MLGTLTASFELTNIGNWLVRGMKSPLKHYQILGVSWMRERERGDSEPRGGILADGMGKCRFPENQQGPNVFESVADARSPLAGLGKTLQTLANIINGKPRGKDKGPKTTLIVATPSLLTQASVTPPTRPRYGC